MVIFTPRLTSATPFQELLPYDQSMEVTGNIDYINQWINMNDYTVIQ